MFAHHHVQRERLSVRVRMSDILATLERSSFVEFVHLFRPEEGRMGVTVTFVAILELVREGLIDIVQTEAYAPLHVRGAQGARGLRLAVDNDAVEGRTDRRCTATCADDAANWSPSDGTADAGRPRRCERTEKRMSDSYLKNVIEAALLAAARPVSVSELAQIFEEQSRPDRQGNARHARALTADYEGRGVTIKETANGFRFQVRNEFALEVSRLWPDRPRKYSRALLETLALIAYRQPITRAEIENVRGVAVNPEIVKTLMERNWVRVVGHRDVPGHPELLGTTAEFLDYFSLKSIEDLPPLADLKSLSDLNLQLPLPGTGAGRRGRWRGCAAEGMCRQRRSRGGAGARRQRRQARRRGRRRRRRRGTRRAGQFGRRSRRGAAVRRSLTGARIHDPCRVAPRRPPGVAERLQKYLAQRGLASRRGVEEWIRAQRLTVNGRVAELGQKVTAADDIRLDGRSIKVRAAAERPGLHLQSLARRSAA